MKRALLAMLCFVLLGPVVGTLVVCLLTGGVSFLVVFFGIGIGLVFASVAGVIFVCAWQIKDYLYSGSGEFFGGLAGAGAGFGSFALLHLLQGRSPSADYLLLACMVAGAACGQLAAWLIERRNATP